MSILKIGNGINTIGRILGVSVLGLGIIILGGCSADRGKASTNKNTAADLNNNSVKSTTSYEDINAAKFKELIKDNNTVVVDVRTQGEYDSGHVAKSLLIPVDIIGDNLQELDKSKTIILVCRSGRRSAAAADILVRNGFTKVKNLVGGLSGNPELINE